MEAVIRFLYSGRQNILPSMNTSFIGSLGAGETNLDNIKKIESVNTGNTNLGNLVNPILGNPENPDLHNPENPTIDLPENSISNKTRHANSDTIEDPDLVNSEYFFRSKASTNYSSGILEGSDSNLLDDLPNIIDNKLTLNNTLNGGSKLSEGKPVESFQSNGLLFENLLPYGITDRNQFLAIGESTFSINQNQFISPTESFGRKKRTKTKSTSRRSSKNERRLRENEEKLMHDHTRSREKKRPHTIVNLHSTATLEHPPQRRLSAAFIAAVKFPKINHDITTPTSRTSPGPLIDIPMVSAGTSTGTSTGPLIEISTVSAGTPTTSNPSKLETITESIENISQTSKDLSSPLPLVFESQRTSVSENSMTPVWVEARDSAFTSIAPDTPVAVESSSKETSVSINYIETSDTKSSEFHHSTNTITEPSSNDAYTDVVSYLAATKDFSNFTSATNPHLILNITTPDPFIEITQSISFLDHSLPPISGLRKYVEKESNYNQSEVYMNDDNANISNLENEEHDGFLELPKNGQATNITNAPKQGDKTSEMLTSSSQAKNRIIIPSKDHSSVSTSEHKLPSKVTMHRNLNLTKTLVDSNRNLVDFERSPCPDDPCGSEASCFHIKERNRKVYSAESRVGDTHVNTNRKINSPENDNLDTSRRNTNSPDIISLEDLNTNLTRSAPDGYNSSAPGQLVLPRNFICLCSDNTEVEPNVDCPRKTGEFSVKSIIL